MSQDTKQAGDSASKARPPMVVQGFAPPHIAPGYEHLFCQCGCGAPVEAAGEAHAAAAQRQPHQPGHLAPQFRGRAAGPAGGMMQPLMYPAQYPTRQDMQFQSQFAAAAAMTQYANYERMDPYRNPHMPYGPPMELPRGYIVPAAPGAASYLAPTPQLGYYRHYPGMMHMAGGGTDSRAEQGATSGGAGGTPPEAAPPPPHASPTTSTHPKESILGSLLAARSERQLSAASAEAEEASTAKEAEDTPTSPAMGVPASSKRHGSITSSGFLDDDTSGDARSEAKPAAGTGTAHRHHPLVVDSPRNSAGRGASAGGVVGRSGASSKSATASTAAATAMHLSGLRVGYPAEMRGMGGLMPGMAPPPRHAGVNVAPAGTPGVLPPVAPSSMKAMQCIAAAPLPPPQQVASVRPSQSLGFASHDVLEDHVRQQEKKLQKRAANRKSAQLSRKRKKALIEELRYENQDLQRHEDILEVIPDPVFAFDTATGRVWFASNSASAQFGLSVEDLTSACFFDLMTDDCSKRLKVLIDTAAKEVSEVNSSLLHERMTVRFKKRKDAILLGELSGRLSCQGDVMTAVCSVRPLSLATDEIVGKGYIGDASMSELADDTSADQGSSGEDSRSAGTGPTSGSNADSSSSGLGTGCTSIADEGSSIGVPSLSSLEVKRGSASGRPAGSGGSTTGSSGSGTGSAGGVGCSGVRGSINGSTSGSASGATGEGSTGSVVSGVGEEEGSYNSNSDSAPSSGLQEGDDEAPSDSDDGGRRKKQRQTAAESSGRPRSASGPSSSCYPGADSRRKGGCAGSVASCPKQRYTPDGGASQAPRSEVVAGTSMDGSVRPKWEIAARSERVGVVGSSASRKGNEGGIGKNHAP